MVWGLSFVAQSVGMDHVEAFTFNGIRTVIGAIALLPVIFVRDRVASKKNDFNEQNSWKNKTLIKGGIFCGLALFFGANFQQFAFNYSAAGKVGFITALYMVLVPVFGLFIKKNSRQRPIIWISVIIACIGLYLLCLNGSFDINMGDLSALIGAVFFAIHILIIDKYSTLVDGVKMSFIQFAISGVLSVICMFIFEEPQFNAIISIWSEILYAGVMSCSVAFTFQIIGQKDTDPTIASMILCLESVFSVIFGWLILHQALSAREISGCIIMFAAIILTQLPDKKLSVSNK